MASGTGQDPDERLLALVGCIRGVVLELDGTGRYLNAWADDPQLLARPANELAGCTIDEVLGEAGPPYTAMVKRVFATGVVEHLEYPLDLASGRRWFFADVKRVSGADGNNTIVLFARDITDRRETEEALARSEERYRLAARATNDVLWDWNITTDVVTWNVAITAVLGYDELETNVSWWREGIHPDDRPRVLDGIAATLGGTATEWSDHYRFRRHDGVYGDFVDRGLVARDPSGRPYRMVVSMADVTRINKLQRQLLQADRMSALGTLAAGVGHEINNPLSYVIGNLETCIEKLEDESGEMRELLVEACGGANRIAAIVRSLKIFTRPDTVEHKPIEVLSVLEAAISLAEKELRHRARLVRNFEALPRVMANESDLAQVILNLLIRAGRAIPDGNMLAHQIEVTTRHTDGASIAIEIRDTGDRIGPHDLPHVFDPFFTTQRQGLGPGLDLSIAYGLVRQHGGTIRVSSDAQRGTVFTITLPVHVEVTAALPRVLVIDDEILIGRSIARMLRSRANVTVLTQARDGLARMKSEHYDIVLCDLMMAEMNGIELYEELRRTQPDILHRVFFITGGAFTPQAQAFLDVNGASCLDKPIDRERLFSLLPQAAS